MEDTGIALITIGGLLLLGLFTDFLGQHTPLPRVTFLILLGILIGPDVLDILPEINDRWFEGIADMALVMIGFLLGEKLTTSALREYGRLVLLISASVVLSTALLMLGGLILIGEPIEIALLLAAIATATAPAATADVVHEAKGKGRFSNVLLGIVAVDDAWGLIIFSLMLTAAQGIAGHGSGWESFVAGIWDIGGSVLIGIGLGIPIAYLSGRIRPGERTLVEALGAVLLCGGIALWLDVSFLLAAMIMGAVVANFGQEEHRPFHAIEGIEWPFMILFFVLAGASLEIDTVSDIGAVGTAYVLLRMLGRFVGGWIGGCLSHADPSIRQWMGVALMPQAGVALGMALVVNQQLPEFGKTIIPVVIAATVLFEVIGPIFTRTALIRVGECPTNHSN